MVGKWVANPTHPYSFSCDLSVISDILLLTRVFTVGKLESVAQFIFSAT